MSLKKLRLIAAIEQAKARQSEAMAQRERNALEWAQQQRQERAITGMLSTHHRLFNFTPHTDADTLGTDNWKDRS